MAATLPKDILEAASIEDASERLGALLGLSGPVPIAAMRQAVQDPRYARALLSTRHLPALRDRLLKGAQVREKTIGMGTASSSAQLAVKAAGSLLKWGMDGLHPAEPWVIERRLAACAACEFRVPAPDTLIYRGAKVAVGPDAELCSVCHCLINTKAAISTERCPEENPDDPERSRWGDEWIPIEDHPQGPW